MNEYVEFEDQSLAGVPLVGGIVAGVLSFVAGYLSFLTLVSTTGDGFDLTAPVESLVRVGQFFYNSFQVPTFTTQTLRVEQEMDGETVVEEQVTNLWQNDITGSQVVEQHYYVDGNLEESATEAGAIETALTFPEPVYLAVPVVLLLLAGLLVGIRGIGANRVTGDVQSLLGSSLVAGGTITLGFLLVSLLGTYSFTLEGQDALQRPAQLETLIYGFLYPIVLGTVGAAIGLGIRQQRESNQPTVREEVRTSGNDVPSGEVRRGVEVSEESNDVTDAESSDTTE